MSQDDEPPEGPPWMEAVVRELHRLHQLGSVATRETYFGMATVCLALEIDHLPRPYVQVINPRMIRLVWGEGPRTLAIDCRPNSFDLRTTTSRRDISARLSDYRWIEPARRAFRWALPDVAGGHRDLTLQEDEP